MDNIDTPAYSLWHARTAARTAARDVNHLAGLLRAVTGIPRRSAPMDAVLHAAARRGSTITRHLLDAYAAAHGQALAAYTALAELDPQVDIHPLVETPRGTGR